MQPLQGLRIVEVGGTIEAAVATKRFSDFGAGVVKVEPPTGAEMRRIAPFPGDRPHIDTGALHMAFDTGKRSLALELGTPSGREVLGRLLEGADLLVAQLPVPELRALLARIDPESGPSTVAITAHGLDGPYAERIENDLTIFGWSTRAHRHSIKGREPLRYAPNTGLVQVGSTAGMLGLVAIWGRRQDGRRRDVEVAGVEAIMGNVDSSFFLWAVNGAVQPRSGGQARGLYPMGAYPCKDGHVLFSAARHPFFTNLCHVIGYPEMATDPRFTDPTQRADHFEEFRDRLLPWLATRNKYDVFHELQAAGVMVAPVLDASEVMQDAQAQARSSYVTLAQPGPGDEPVETVIPGAPYRMNGLASDAWQARPAPRLGEHTGELLDELGYTRDEQIALFRAGVTG